jgi:peptidoglycan glycosyltransferase
MVAGAEAFGFNDTPPIDLPNAAASAFPTDFVRDTPKLAQAAIGQNDVQGTPLQMAMVAAAIANDGRIMTPHVMHEIRDGEGEVVEEYDPKVWKRATSASSAATLRVAMLGVVESGTATRLQIPGVDVGGKTGTAQLGTDPPTSHAWVIAFAGPPRERPVIAVAVLVEAQVGASEQTGGRVAAPIARAVIEAALASGRLEPSGDDDEVLEPPSTAGGSSTVAPGPAPPTTAAPVPVAPTTSSAATTTPAAPTTTTPPPPTSPPSPPPGTTPD